MAGWHRAYGEVAPLSSQAFAGGNAFTVAGAPTARNALVLEAAADADLSGSTRIGLRYNGQIARYSDQHSVNANLAMRF